MVICAKFVHKMLGEIIEKERIQIFVQKYYSKEKISKKGDALMQKIKFLIRLWMNEPVWFKCLTVSTLLISIVFSSSIFSYNTNYQSLAKLATAIFFYAFGFIFRRNLKLSIIFFSLVIICIFLAWNSFDYASL